MTEVQNRKMFRRKDARNKLRQLGGIMTSSPDLMQSVQKFSRGGIAQAQRRRRQLQNRLPNLFPGPPTMGMNPRAALIAQEDDLREQPFLSSQRTVDQTTGLPLTVTVDRSLSPAIKELLREPRTGTGTGTGVADRDLSDADDPTVALTEPPIITETDVEIDPLSVGLDVVGYAKMLKDSKASEKQKNDQILELLNQKAPKEKLTLEQRFERMKKARKAVFGDSSQAEKSIDGFNLAMLGFAIASGDSPNALTNIAKGALAGAQQMQATAERRRAREERLKESDFQAALQDDRMAQQVEREEKRWKDGQMLSWLSSRISDERQNQSVAMQMSQQIAMMKFELAAKTRAARRLEKNTERRFQLEQEAKQEKALLDSLENPSFGLIALQQLESEGINIGDSNFGSALVDKMKVLSEDPQLQAIISANQRRKTGQPYDPNRFAQELQRNIREDSPVYEAAVERVNNRLKNTKYYDKKNKQVNTGAYPNYNQDIYDEVIRITRQQAGLPTDLTVFPPAAATPAAATPAAATPAADVLDNFDDYQLLSD